MNTASAITAPAPAPVPAVKGIRVRHPLRRRLLDVRAADAITPRMRRIVLGGAELDGFVSAAPDDHVKLFFPPAGAVLDADRNTEGWAARDYTPRRFDPAAGTLTIEFVVHGDGPGSGWAAAARPGDRILVGGPRGSWLAAEDHDAMLLVGDETALPAIARYLEEMRPGIPVLALIEVEDRAEERRLPTAAQARIHWIHRDGRAAGTATLLERALESVELPGKRLQCWIGAEIDTARRLRGHLLQERGLAREDVRAAGYWRLGGTGSGGKLDE